MVKKDSVSIAVMASATALPLAAGVVFQWDGQSGVCQEVEPNPLMVQGQHAAFQVPEPLSAHHASPYWTTREIGRAPVVSLPLLEWKQEAACLTFSLAPGLLAATGPAVLAGVTGELVWVHWPEQREALSLAVHPVLVVHTPYEGLGAERVNIRPALRVADPLHQHSALVLHAALTGEGVPERLYAQALADALVGHFLRRYWASQPAVPAVRKGLSPYKLRCTTDYIQAHLAQGLSLAQLAAVSQTSPAHFARLFKQATRLSPHQYVLARRIAAAQHLLTATDLALSEIALQVGCADQSHFSALFRAHGGLTPTAYRDQTRMN
jgi:AraC-like DNA-binding protein